VRAPGNDARRKADVRKHRITATDPPIVDPAAHRRSVRERDPTGRLRWKLEQPDSGIAVRRHHVGVDGDDYVPSEKC
jgi:hypothetical protein